MKTGDVVVMQETDFVVKFVCPGCKQYFYAVCDDEDSYPVVDISNEVANFVQRGGKWHMK